MADDGHGADCVLVQAGGELVQDGGKVRLDGGAAHIKRHIAGDVELQAVVLRLAHSHAGADSRAFHRGFLILHFL